MIIMVTFSLFLVTLKKSSIWVCLLRPAAVSFFRSSRLLSRVWRNFSIRRRTLSTLKIWILTIHSSLWKTEKHEKRGSWVWEKKTWCARTLHVWSDRETQPRLPRLAPSRPVQELQSLVHPKISYVLLCTSRNVEQDESDGKQVLVSLLILMFLAKQCTERTTKTTESP